MPRKEEAPIKEQLVSTILGMAIVIVVGILAYNHFKRGEEEQPVSTIPGEQLPGVLPQEAALTPTTTLPAVYKVQKGDHLWKIAEKFYRSGYNWLDIAKENKLNNPNLIAVGQELKIPDVKPRVITAVGPAPIKPGQYTVQEGDWLSKLALRAYGDMFAWEKIYQANKALIGNNPNSIEVGMVLTIPE